MFGLMFALARMASAAWVGAAALFVMVAVSQTTSGQFSREQLNMLAAMRFPFYYATGAVLIGVSLFCSLFLRRRYLKASRWMLVVGSLAGAAALMSYDYQSVYKPLLGMITPPDKPEDSAFDTLHKHSEVVNGAVVSLVFFASLMLCLPGTRPAPPTILMQHASED